MRQSWNSYSAPSYSQEGEDMVLRRIFLAVKHGFYIDVGAYHPKHLSNTYFFYRNGWRGINIDAMPGSMQAFRRVRPRDINLEAVIARERKEMNFYIFNGRALNTLDPDLARERSVGSTKILEVRAVITQRLDEVLAQHLAPHHSIQFMSIDVEGFDLDVLQSNNWSLYRPEYVLVEAWDFSLQHADEHPIVQFLTQHDYHLAGKTFSTIFFGDNRHGA
jgi:FkbM family methyltransferase